MRNKKLLIIEDHNDCRKLLDIVLTRSGYLVTQAGTALEGMERASASHPDLIVMDYGLPDATADSMIKSLKATPSTKNVPIIVTTGYMRAEIIQRAKAAGAATVLIKPYDIDQLLLEIERCLSVSVQTSSQPLAGNQPAAD